jgi:NADH-quinone oxidoreductase subunit I
MFTVFRQLFRKPTTVKYPFVKQEMMPRYRGLHFLERYEDGSERCVCCGLCEPAENEKGERYARIYEINELRCIFCGFCEEACPEEAIFLGKEFEFIDDHRDKFIYAKEKLLVKWPREKPSPVKFERPLRRVHWEDPKQPRPQQQVGREASEE